MLSDPIDLRVYLSDWEFKQRVLKSKAWSDYLKLPLITAFDDDAARSEIEDRNAIRSASHLPLLDVNIEIAGLRETYESETWSDRFYELAANCITEIYGSLTPKDFNSHSAMRGFFVCKQRVIRDLVAGAARGRNDRKLFPPR
jgi:hypothetical protein